MPLDGRHASGTDEGIKTAPVLSSFTPYHNMIFFYKSIRIFGIIVI